ncbi:hypothetical protein ACPCYY_20900, partial [Bacillus pumilus]
FDNKKIYAMLNNDGNIILASIDPKSHKDKRKTLDVDSVFYPENNESLNNLEDKDFMIALNDAVDSTHTSILIILDKKTLDT